MRRAIETFVAHTKPFVAAKPGLEIRGRVPNIHLTKHRSINPPLRCPEGINKSPKKRGRPRKYACGQARAQVDVVRKRERRRSEALKRRERLHAQFYGRIMY